MRSASECAKWQSDLRHCRHDFRSRVRLDVQVRAKERTRCAACCAVGDAEEPGGGATTGRAGVSIGLMGSDRTVELADPVDELGVGFDEFDSVLLRKPLAAAPARRAENARVPCGGRGDR